ncbi:GtrA family protein [Streptomyces sp. NPDC005195]|uniref:GtrA family protein n=1 Tax=Streptomyces sp. NPDC005195 TaxID=3154561 RepID=UPI0033AAF4DB
MSVQSTGKPPASRPVTVFVRFVVCGGAVGAASSGGLVLLDGILPLVVANALVTLVSTVIATELHQRVTFRSPRSGWGAHLQSSLTVALSFALTTGALLILHAASPKPAALVEQGVYLSVSALAGTIRFVLLRAVFSHDTASVTRHVRVLAACPARRARHERTSDVRGGASRPLGPARGVHRSQPGALPCSRPLQQKLCTTDAAVVPPAAGGYGAG